MHPVTALYEGILRAVSLQADPQGLISMKMGDYVEPIEIDGKRLVLPTQDILRASQWSTQMAFHPLSENVLRGESPVIKKLRIFANLRLTFVICELLSELMDIAADSNKHKQLSPAQAAFLTEVPEVDSDTVAVLTRVIKRISPTGENRAVNIYLKRGGSFKGTSYQRIGVVSFPIADEFEKAEHQIFGEKMRKKDKAAIIALFNWILPNYDNPETYTFGSNSMVAPYFVALMNSFAAVARQLNSVTYRFRKHLSNADELMIDLDWVDNFDELAKYRELIPALAGNDGDMVEKEGAAPAPGVAQRMLGMAKEAVHEPVTAPKPAIAPTPPAPFSSQPAPAAAPVAAAPAAAPTTQMPRPLGKTMGSAATPVTATAAIAAPANDPGVDWEMTVMQKSMMQRPAWPTFPTVGGGQPGYQPQPGYAPPQPQTMGAYPGYGAPAGYGYPGPAPAMPVFPAVGGGNVMQPQRQAWPPMGGSSSV